MRVLIKLVMFYLVIGVVVTIYARIKFGLGTGPGDNDFGSNAMQVLTWPANVGGIISSKGLA